jgi:hypothetical protein
MEQRDEREMINIMARSTNRYLNAGAACELTAKRDGFAV